MRSSTLLLLVLLTLTTLTRADQPPVLLASATVEFGPDRGQNFGTLFEVFDANGRVIAGAGFAGAYNTQPRSDRELLQVFLRPPGVARAWEVERLPALDSPATGFYPFSHSGSVYIHNRGVKGRRPDDPAVYRWDAAGHKWVDDPAVIPYAERVAGKLLAVTGDAVTYDGKVLLKPDGQARFAEHYFAGGNLFLKEDDREAKPPLNRLVVCPWKPESDTALTRRPEWTLELPIPFEFVYAFGQWRGEVLAVSNNGRLARFDGKAWSILREPVPNVSYQIYSALTFHDRLLFGHYPTGELIEYTGQDLKLLTGWPPALPGVSPSAREAQTLAIYGGDLYVGVWPWAEVWRFDRERGKWAFADRMFRHPQPTDSVVHPYEAETRQVDAVYNLWGQRVTGLQPHGAGLVITSSSKTGAPWEPKFSFLTASQRADYGAIYLATVPGNLAAAVEWKPGPTRFEVKLVGNTLSVVQDGRTLGSEVIPERMMAAFRPAKVVWGEGVFGSWAGKIVERSAAVQTVVGPRVWRATYLHLERLIPNDADADTMERTVASILDSAQRSGINTILPYATGSRGQAYYPSKHVPTLHYAAIDPIGAVVRAARSRGLAVYPVMCVTVCGNESPTGILEKQPAWGLLHPDGKPLGYISPAHPAARAWLAGVAREMVDLYRPDGILLDYIRFHNRELRLDPAAEKRFEATLPADCPPAEKTKRLQAFKEAEMTELVREISTAVRTARPDTVVAAYCWGHQTLANHLTAQVWDQWVEKGYIDMVNVSGYFHHSKYGDAYMATFEKYLTGARKANEALSRRATLTFALGLKTSHGDVRSADDIRGYLHSANRLGLNGVAFFTWDTLLPYLDELDRTRDILTAFPDR
jgi:uncharacterized lipoprotein YddW (UPF0748 family)